MNHFTAYTEQAKKPGGKLCTDLQSLAGNQEQQKGEKSHKYVTNCAVNHSYHRIKGHSPRLCIYITKRTTCRIKTV
ncbi:hypothetical protein ES703_98905 [subsurface metagenome]